MCKEEMAMGRLYCRISIRQVDTNINRMEDKNAAREDL